MSEVGWQTLKDPWFKTTILNCAFCGRMIPTRYWSEDPMDPSAAKFCSPRCAELSQPRTGTEG